MLWVIETIFLSIIHHKYVHQNQQKYFDNSKKQLSFLPLKIYLTIGNISQPTHLWLGLMQRQLKVTKLKLEYFFGYILIHLWWIQNLSTDTVSKISEFQFYTNK